MSIGGECTINSALLGTAELIAGGYWAEEALPISSLEILRFA
jgi:hypothetical protein